MPVEVTGSSLTFSFPTIAADASMSVTFERTLRVPDDATTYGLPPSLGTFEVRSHDNGIDALMPMWQSEASWINFSASKPFLVKVGAGEINAVTGAPWSPAPDFAAEDYLEVPEQPWLDGFCVDTNVVRQFVAMPLGDGYTVEEQLSDTPSLGGIWLSVCPLKKSVWDERPLQRGPGDMTVDFCATPLAGMGLGAGGSITQSIATPVEPHTNWDTKAQASIFVEIANSAQWQSLTGSHPHSRPLTIEQYLEYGYPWFEWYDDTLARVGSDRLAEVATVRSVSGKRGDSALPDNTFFTPPKPIVIGP